MGGSCSGPAEAWGPGRWRRRGECLRPRLPWRMEQQGRPREVPTKEVRENTLAQDPVTAPARGVSGVERGQEENRAWGGVRQGQRSLGGPEVGDRQCP